jgi:hypothetical protein
LEPSRLVSTARKKEVTPEALTKYYTGLDTIIKEKLAGTDRIYNVDETGLQEGESHAGVVRRTILTTVAEKTLSDFTTWITILESISASGRRLKPCVVFSGGTAQGQWFPDMIPNWMYIATHSGWSDTEILMKWSMKVFLPETKPADESLWRIFVLDRHKTHITGKLMIKAWVNNVWLSWLPSHSSYITQPLDVTVFGPLKTYYRQETVGWGSYDTTISRQKQLFVTAYKAASEKAFSQENVRKGFHATGIYPVDVSKGLSALKPKERRRWMRLAPTTRQKAPEVAGTLWPTPHCSEDTKKQIDDINLDENIVGRDLEDILRKVYKCINVDKSRITHLAQEVAFLKASQAAKEPTGRSTVRFDPNDAFPSFDQIVTARDRAKKNTLRLKERQAPKPRQKKREKPQPVEEKFFYRYTKRN